MTVFVTVEMFQGLVSDIQVFLMPESAQRAREEWLKKHGINAVQSEELSSADGSGFHLEECELKP